MIFNSRIDRSPVVYMAQLLLLDNDHTQVSGQ